MEVLKSFEKNSSVNVGFKILVMVFQCPKTFRELLEMGPWIGPPPSDRKYMYDAQTTSYQVYAHALCTGQRNNNDTLQESTD